MVHKRKDVQYFSIKYFDFLTLRLAWIKKKKWDVINMKYTHLLGHLFNDFWQYTYYWITTT